MSWVAADVEPSGPRGCAGCLSAASASSEFELDTERCELSCSGRYIKLERIPMQMLILFLENPGKLVPRETIIERLWGGGVFIEAEHSINTAINKLRTTLRDDSRKPRFIRTVVGQGYCFIAKVSVLQPVPAAVISQTASYAEEITYDLPSTIGNGHSSGLTVKDEPILATSNLQVAEEPPAQEVPAVVAKKVYRNTIVLLLGTLTAFMLIAAAIYLLRKQDKTPPPSQEASEFHAVAVLPFRNLAQTANQDYLVDGLTDQLITDLARSTSLRVISRTSVMQYKDAQKPIQEIARALNVDAIIEGSYLRAGDQVRITVQLLDARNDRHLWAQSYDESNKDLFATQDKVTTDIVQQVAIVLGSGFTRSKLRTVNWRARDAYLRGRYFWNERTLAAITTSVKYYTEAIREDPNYADAYAALAETYVLLSMYGGPQSDDLLWKAQYAAERALLLDSSLGATHTALGAVKAERDWDWAGAEREYRRAIQLSPADPTAHYWYSLHLSRLGKTQEAEIEMKQALALDPLSLMINTDAAATAYWARDSNKAMARVQGVIALDPDFPEAHLAMGKVLEQIHKYQEAKVEFEIAGKNFRGASKVDALLARAMALAGEREGALKIVRGLESASSKPYVSGADIAEVYCALHQTDDAMKWLDRAYRQHDNGMGLIGIDPLFDGCRSRSPLWQSVKTAQIRLIKSLIAIRRTRVSCSCCVSILF